MSVELIVLVVVLVAALAAALLGAYLTAHRLDRLHIRTDLARRSELCTRGSEAVREYDWPVVADRVIRVYETIRGPGETLRVR